MAYRKSYFSSQNLRQTPSAKHWNTPGTQFPKPACQRHLVPGTWSRKPPTPEPTDPTVRRDPESVPLLGKKRGTLCQVAISEVFLNCPTVLLPYPAFTDTWASGGDCAFENWTNHRDHSTLFKQCCVGKACLLWLLLLPADWIHPFFGALVDSHFKISSYIVHIFPCHHSNQGPTKARKVLERTQLEQHSKLLCHSILLIDSYGSLRWLVILCVTR